MSTKTPKLIGLFVGLAFAMITVACLSVRAQSPVPPPPYAALPVARTMERQEIYRLVDPQFKVVCYIAGVQTISCIKYQ